MKNGEYKDGEKVLRAKIDMASPNINMRDPVIYPLKSQTNAFPFWISFTAHAYMTSK